MQDLQREMDMLKGQIERSQSALDGDSQVHGVLCPSCAATREQETRLTLHSMYASRSETMVPSNFDSPRSGAHFKCAYELHRNQ
jgi:hypothetical protein